MQPTTPSRFAAFGPRNYRLMGLGIAVLAAGFLTMTLDKTQYGEGLLGITIGPILLVLGFVVEFFAIMVRDPATVAAAGMAAGTAPAAAAPLNVTLSDTPAVPPAGSAPAGPAPAGPAAAPTRPSYKPL